jgi:hypothetical protein
MNNEHSIEERKYELGCFLECYHRKYLPYDTFYEGYVIVGLSVIGKGP